MAEAAAHYRMQEAIDRAAVQGDLPDPADPVLFCSCTAISTRMPRLTCSPCAVESKALS
jgi:hypothetical protein